MDVVCPHWHGHYVCQWLSRKFVTSAANRDEFSVSLSASFFTYTHLPSASANSGTDGCSAGSFARTRRDACDRNRGRHDYWQRDIPGSSRNDAGRGLSPPGLSCVAGRRSAVV